MLELNYRVNKVRQELADKRRAEKVAKRNENAAKKRAVSAPSCSHRTPSSASPTTIYHPP